MMSATTAGPRSIKPDSYFGFPIGVSLSTALPERLQFGSIIAGRLARRLSLEMCKRMKLTNFFIAVGCALFLFAGSALAADKQVTTKQTCCELAAAKSKDCRHKCCVAAHRDGKSCTVCNPQQQDLKLKRYSKKAVKSAEATTQK